MQAKKWILTFVSLIILWNVSEMRPEAREVMNSSQLVEDSHFYDQKEVTISGEVIGKPLDRGSYVWVNINDGENAIGIRVLKKDLPQIKYYGNYKEKGDLIRVNGVFYRACRQHGGETDIHGTTVRIIQQGKIIKHSIDARKVIIGLGILLIAFGLSVRTIYSVNKKKIN